MPVVVVDGPGALKIEVNGYATDLHRLIKS
jgi:hypothetical protein